MRLVVLQTRYSNGTVFDSICEDLEFQEITKFFPTGRIDDTCSGFHYLNICKQTLVEVWYEDTKIRPLNTR